MRRAAGIAILFLLLVAHPARAEFPAAVSAWAGAGYGSGQHEDLTDSGFFGLLGADAAWRFGPGRALIVTCEGSGGLTGGGYALAGASSLLRSVDHAAITIGPEWSFPRRSGVAFFLRGAIGAGRVTSEIRRGLAGSVGPASTAFETRRETGLALSGAAGIRLVPRPGPLGCSLAIRGAQTSARHSGCGAVGVTFGVTIYPLERRHAAGSLS